MGKFFYLLSHDAANKIHRHPHKADMCGGYPIPRLSTTLYVCVCVGPLNIHGLNAAGTESGIKTMGTTEMRKRASEFAARLFYRIILSAILFIFFSPHIFFCTFFSPCLF